MRTTVRSIHGLVGLGPFPRGHAGNRVVTVTTISTSGTMYGRTTAMASQARVVRGNTTTGTGVSLYTYVYLCVLN